MYLLFYFKKIRVFLTVASRNVILKIIEEGHEIDFCNRVHILTI